MRQVWNTIAQFHMLEQGDNVLLGVSGGPDSVALLHLLHRYAEQHEIGLYVVHVNHQLRPEAEQEAAYVQHLTKLYNIPFRLYTVDVAAYAEQHGMSLEQAGHMVRFQCFRDAKSRWNITKLALGHHRDDRAESVLMHIMQGCGLDGLTAMPPIDLWDSEDNSRLIRPLAQVSKQELLMYCRQHELHYFIDATNLKPDCLRNQIRLELLPQMQQYNPQIADALVRMQDSCSADLDYIQQQVQRLWEQHGSMEKHAAQFPADVFRAQHTALQRRLLRLLYQQWNGSVENLTFAQVEQMRAIALQCDGTQQVTLADNVVFLRQYNLLKITEQKTVTQEPQEHIWQIYSQSEMKAYDGCFTAELFDKNPKLGSHDYYTIAVDAECLEDALLIRSRKPGDTIQPAGMQGHKKLKKFFIDAKIPRPERDNIPLVLSGEEIIWIPGYFAADCVKITENTKQFCILNFSRRHF